MRPTAEAMRQNEPGSGLGGAVGGTAPLVSRMSPNYGPRLGGVLPDLIVLHHTAMKSNAAALERLCDPMAEVSAHYLIGEDGGIHALVPEEARAWHAGAGYWGGKGDVNSRSIGIELTNAGPGGGFPPFPEAQMQALEALLGEIRARWSIPPAHIIANSDMAPGRKSDPGPKFDWRRLALSGHSAWPNVTPSAHADADWPTFCEAATQVGYAPPEGDWDAVLAAFRLRFRPGVHTAPLDGTDVALAEWLAAHHPFVDAVPSRA